MVRKSESGRGCWYFVEVHECPVCGKCDIYKERQYTKKPKEWVERNKIYEYYDYCLERAY